MVNGQKSSLGNAKLALFFTAACVLRVLSLNGHCSVGSQFQGALDGKIRIHIEFCIGAHELTCKTIDFGGCHGHSKHCLKRLILRQEVAATPTDVVGSILDLRRSILAQKLRN